mgnify:CR=1 FL=1
MTKGMRKDFQREIKLNFSRFLSITLIVVLGVAFFSGLRAAKPAMQPRRISNTTVKTLWI